MATACAGSVAVHGVCLLVLVGTGAFSTGISPRSWAVALRAVSPAQWEANRGLPGALQPAPKQADPPRRIISLPPDHGADPLRADREPPRDTRHLAERDQTVEAETVSRHAGSFARSLRVPQEASGGRAGSGERGKKKIARPGQEGPRGGGGRDEPAPKPEAPAPAPLSATPAAPPAETEERGLPPPENTALAADGGEDGQRIEGRRIADAPLHENPRPEGGPEAEGLEYDEGAETRLHAKRFAPAAFWSDVRRRIQDEWEKRALAAVKKLDPYEDTYFYKPRTVLIRVALDAAGGVRDARVLESSRLDFYDDLALATVAQQQPYPQPPPGALGPDGAARINVRFTWLPSVGLRALR